MGLFGAKGRIKGLLKKAQALHKKRVEGKASDAETKKEISIYMNLYKIYTKKRFSKKFPNAIFYAQESLRAAANLRDKEAQYLLAAMLYERGCFWKDMLEHPLSAKLQEKYAKDSFDEGFAFLQAAEEQGHVLAKRLHGQVLVKGWGTEINVDDGFKLIVASIEEEGTWHRAMKIFDELGLNKPEFYSQIMAMKNKPDE